MHGPPGDKRISVEDVLHTLLVAITKRTPQEAAKAYLNAGGYEIGWVERCTCLSAYDGLSAATAGGTDLRFDTVRARCLNLAFLLGIEQGRRMERYLPMGPEEEGETNGEIRLQLAMVRRLRRRIMGAPDGDVSPDLGQRLADEERLLGKLIADEAENGP